MHSMLEWKLTLACVAVGTLLSLDARAQTAVYYSVGTSAADLKNGSPTVTIAGGVATFTSAQPDNVGLGDEITYNGGTRAYISGRTSATVYSVTTATGAVPPNIAGATVNSIRRSFNSLTNAEASSSDASHLNATDLIVADVQLNWVCYDDAPLDDGDINIDGWTTGAANYIRIFAPHAASEVGVSQRHSGVAGTGFRLERSADLTGVGIFRYFFIFEEYVRIEGIELDGSSLTNGNRMQAIRTDDAVSPVSDLRFESLIIHDFVNSDVDNTSDMDVFGFLLRNGSVKISNTVIYNLENANTNAAASPFAIQTVGPNTGTSFFYNNTIYNLVNSSGNGNPARGIAQSAGAVTARNNAVLNMTPSSVCFQGAMTQNNNVSSDGTATGATGQTSYATYFVSVTPGSENLHLLGDSASLWTIAGADLDSDANLPVTNDIDAEARDATAPDIGADEFGSSAGARTVYYSVGTSVADLKNGAPTITIASGVATLSIAQPDNVGVGDEITYDGGTIAYVSGRTSSTVYNVTTATGGIPADVVGANVNSVARAFNTISAASSGSADASHLNTSDLLAGNIQLNWAAYDDGPMSDVTSGWVGADISGWTTGAVNFIRLFAPASTSEVGVSQRHTGVAGTGFRLVPIQPAPNSFFPIVNVTIGHLRLEGIEIDGSSVSNGEEVDGIHVTGFATAGSDVRFDKLLVHGISNTTIDDSDASFTKGIAMQDGNLRLSNTIIYDITNVSTHLGSFAMGVELNEPTATHYMFNNTFYRILQNAGSGGAEADGIVEWSGAATVRNTFIGNVVSLSGAENCFRSVTTQSNNVSSDGTATGATGQNLYATYFKSVVPGSEDLHLLGDSVSLWTLAGMDLDTDPNLPVVDDIDGEPRDPSAPDIGADEVLAIDVFYSVGTSYPADLKTGSPSISIAAGTATLSVGQTGNLGVGDLIDYGASQFAFIHAVVSQTVFEVRTAVGALPPDTGAVSVNVIRRSFASITDAESGTAAAVGTTDLIGAGVRVTWVVYNDAPLVEAAQIDGYITDATHFITLTAASSAQVASGVSQRHYGTASTGAVVRPAAAGGYAIYVGDSYTVVEWLELDGTNVTASGSDGVEVGVGGWNATLQNLVIHHWDETSDDGIWVNNDNVTVRNCFIYINEGSLRLDGDNAIVHNVTIHGGISYGLFVGPTSGHTVENVIAVSSATDFSGVGSVSVSNNNLSSDGTANAFGGSGHITGAADAEQFVSIASGIEDLHLRPGADAIDAGVDRSGSFTGDIDAQRRPLQLQWDIGADETQWSSANPVYYSIGSNGGNLMAGSPTVDVASGTATFSTPQPNKVGAGDVITYGGNTAYIWRRASSTVYYVLDAVGGVPPDAAATPVTSITRAFTSLSLAQAGSSDASHLNGSDLVAGDFQLNWVCYNDGPLDDRLDLAGWTTGPDNYIRIYTPVSSSEVGVSQRHTGIAGSGFRIAPNDATVAAYQIIFLRTEFVRIEGLEIDGSGLTAARSARGVALLKNMANAGDIRVSSNIIHDLHTTQPGNNFDGSFGVYAFEDVDNMGPPLLVTNNFIYDVTANIPEDNHHIGGIHISTRTTSWVYNNTIFHIRHTGGAPGGATWGIEVSGWPAGTATVVATNNFVGDLMSTNDVEIAFESNNGGAFIQSYNVTSDGTASGTGSQTGQTSYGTYFQNILDGTEDLHITANSATLWGTSGTDLSSSFTVDIDGGARQTPWDIGADDVLATTAVKLIGFEARPSVSAVELLWETGSELNNLGFHIYRSLSADGPYERITSRVIPGLGNSAAGARYGYRDESLVNGTTYYYELEDIETTGATKRHGPVWASPSSEASPLEEPAEGAPSETTRITYGDPSANELRVVKEGNRFVILELRTEGFYALPQEDGSVALEIPGFDGIGQAGTPTLPVKHHWVEALAGRKVELQWVRGRMESVTGAWEVTSELSELVASPSGTVTARRRRRMNVKAQGLFPSEAGRVVTVAFQGESKKALVEMAPLRWVADSGELYLAKRLTLRLSFEGVDTSELSLGGKRGRRRARKFEKSHGVLARLATRERGLYGVRYEDVFGAGGSLPTRALRLSRQGEDVALHVDGNVWAPGAMLYFVSEGAEANRFGNEAVYELELSSKKQPGVRMETLEAAGWGVASSFYWKRLSQEDNRYYQAGLVEAPELWLWDLLLAPVTKSYRFEVTSLANAVEPGRLEVWLQGTSDTPSYPDHHVRVSVNGSVLTEASWNGKAAYQVSVELSPGVLVEGNNELELTNVGDTEASYSTVMLDRFAVEYPRQLVVESGELEGRFSESGRATIAGLSEQSHVLETSATPRWIQNGPSFAVEAGKSYLVVEPEAVRTPEVRRPTATTLASPRNQADYVVIGPRAFVEAAEPLLVHRAEQGLVSKGVAIEDVYAEFGHGESSPEAIRDFLEYAYHEWRAPSLRYVVLLGDGSYDYKDYGGLGGSNPVPPLMVKTSYLWTASDPTLAAVNGDDLLPDVAIGRLPAANLDEVITLVEKILAWESNDYGLDGPAVFVADNPDGAGNFEADADAAIGHLPVGSDVSRIYLSELGASETKNRILDAFDNGASLMSYIGHGGIHLWADENFFNTGQLSSLAEQPRQPLLLTMNCLNGYFHFPYFGSLAEELLKAEHKGVIAAFSPSGLSLNTPAQTFHQAMLDELFSRRHLRLGDAMLAAQETYLESGAFPELLSIYHLFGDPALLIHSR